MGLLSGLFESLFGSKDKMKKIPTMTSEQQMLLNSLLGNLGDLQQGGYQDAMGLLQDYLNPESDIYKNFEAPYLREFEQQTIPNLAERFAGYGGGLGGGLSSSGFGQALGAAGGNLQTNLAAMKSQMQRGSIQDILGQMNQMTNTGLNAQPFAYQYKPGGAGILPTMAANAAGPLASYGMMNFMQSNRKNTQNSTFQNQFPLSNYFN